jgi:hypothetical protein
MGIGIQVQESCLCQALRAGGIPSATCDDISTHLLTQFQEIGTKGKRKGTDGQYGALWVMEHWNLPCALYAYPGGSGMRTEKDCPGRQVICRINCWHGHYMCATWQEMDWVQGLYDQGLLVPRKAGDMPRRRIQLPPLRAVPYNPETCVRHWMRRNFVANITEEEWAFGRVFVNKRQINPADIWSFFAKFSNECLSGVDEYTGIIKFIAKQNAKRDAAEDPDPRFRKQTIVLKVPGEYEGAWISLDFNSFFPWAMTQCDPPTGNPRFDAELDDYIYEHIHKPEVIDFIEK